MNRRFVLAAALPIFLALTAAAPPRRAVRSVPPPPAAPLPDLVRVAMVTEKGTIEIDLDVKHAPISAGNFVRYVDLRKFDGMTFYRAMRLAWGDQPNGLIQAGLRGDPRKVLKPIAHEPTSVTGILHKAGTLSMGRLAPGTAAADFSILLSDIPQLDADPKATDAEGQAGYAAFGHVVSGMDVVRAIWDSPLSPTAGEGPMKGQMLTPPIRVLTVRRVALPAAPAAAAALVK
ncbi:MAG: peptidylprolyl isomerase [Sphingomonadales bacterium]|nr:peptidylprolyl isomerase [Sphingomonadales bacterium]